MKNLFGSCFMCLVFKYQAIFKADTDTTPETICSHFAADVLVKGKVLDFKGNILESHTSTLNLKDEKAETLKDALMILLSHYKTMKTVQIRVDNQPGFYSGKINWLV